MKIVMIAADVGPSNSLTLVEPELEQEGHSVTTFFGQGQPFPEKTADEIADTVSQADIVLLGLSSTPSRAREELLAGQLARQKGARLALFCDTYGAYNRSWFQALIPTAHILFIVSKQETAIAQTLAPRAKIAVAGNPDWTRHFGEPPHSREQVRQQLDLGAGEQLILSVGSKEAARNFSLWNNLIMATNRMPGKSWRLVLARHPGERQAAELYAELLGYSDYPIQLLEGLSSTEALVGTDLVVSSLSTIGIAAACRRIPVIDFVTDLDKRWWQILSGNRIWPPAIQEASWEVDTLGGLQVGISTLLATHSPEARNMKIAQERAFAAEKMQGAAIKIATTLVG